jgi:hypothetical protein
MDHAPRRRRRARRPGPDRGLTTPRRRAYGDWERIDSIGAPVQVIFRRVEA